MNGILRFESSSHRQTELMLPWYVNHTLQGDELALVERHLQECLRCQSTASELQNLQRACVEDRAGDPNSSLERLRRRINAPMDASVGRKLPPPGRLSVARNSWTGAPPWLRWVTSAQAVTLLVMAGWLFADAPPGASYRTLGDADTAVPPTTVDSTRRLVVVFDPQISASRIQVLLRASQARIVDGPNEAGAYVLDVPAGRVTGVQAALRSAPGVLLVESLDPVDRH